MAEISSNTSNNVNGNNVNQRKDDEMTLSDMLVVAKAYWKWFLISLVVCLGLAYLYCKRSPNIYKREAIVLIKGDGKNQGMESETQAFEDLGIVNFGKSVDNELLIFKSKRLMIETVRRLHAEIDYSRKGRFREFTLYAETPVKLTFPDAKEDDLYSLVMTPEKGGMVRLHSFQNVKEEKEYEKDVLAKPGTTVATPIGKIQVESNVNELAQPLVGVDINVRKYSVKETGKAYSNLLQTSLASKQSTVISLSLQDESKERAEDILNTLIDIYNEDAVNDKNKVVVNTDKFINDRLITLENELGNVDMTIANFKSSHQLTDISADVSAFRSSYDRIESQAAQLQSQKAVAQYILDYIHSIEARGEGRYEIIPNNAGINNAAVEGLISQYNTVTLQREKLQLDAGPNNPQVQDLGNQIDQLRTRIVSSIHNLVKSLDIELANVNSRAGESTSRIVAVPGQQKTVTNVERQQRIKENLYMYLLNKREANNLKKNMTESNARIIDPAEGGEKPIAPRKSMIMLVGLIAGLVIPSAFIWFFVLGTTKVRGRKDISRLTMPFIGDIPEVEDRSRIAWLKKLFSRNTKNGHRKARKIVVTKDSKDPVSEAVRIMRTNLQMLQAGDKSKKVIMMTSYLPGAGKTFVTCNLGMSLALAGKKVIMVDLDIRRASLSSTFGRHLQGVTNYLGGYSDNIDEFIVHSKESENLDILPAGVAAPNPAELLMLPALDEMVEKLKERYDYVFLDNVPANVVADAMIVNRLADITVFVIRAGNLDRRMLPDVEQLYNEGKLKNMCVALNGVSKAHIYTSYYGYGYHSYYGY